LFGSEEGSWGYDKGPQDGVLRTEVAPSSIENGQRSGKKAAKGAQAAFNEK